MGHRSDAAYYLIEEARKDVMSKQIAVPEIGRIVVVLPHQVGSEVVVRDAVALVGTL